MKNLHNSKKAVLLRTKSEKQQKLWQYAYELQIVVLPAEISTL